MEFTADRVVMCDNQGRPLMLAYYHAEQLILKTVLDDDFAAHCKLFGFTPPVVERVAIGH